MDHKVITFIKWLFLVIGLGMLIGAWFSNLNGGEIIIFFLGLVFASIGGGIIAHGWWSRRKEAALRQHGHLVQAEFQQVELNQALEVNGANPFRVVAQWLDVRSNTLFVFRSANLWFDPTRFVQGRTIPVYVDLAKPSRYHVDLSFLPTLQS